MTSILIIEDEEVIRKQLTKLLERNNYIVTSAPTIEAAQQVDPDSHDVILADIRLPGAPGTAILQQVRHAPVVIMTSHASVRSAVDSMKLGAVDYISKPFDHDELLMVIQRSLRENRLSAQNAAMRFDLQRLAPATDLITRTPELIELTDKLSTLPEQDRFVFLHGERGSGKELLARYIHEHSSRSNSPLVMTDLPLYRATELDRLLFGTAGKSAGGAVDSGADIPDSQSNGFSHPSGVLRAAHTGTLVLRSIIELPVESQRLLYEWAQQTSGTNQSSSSSSGKPDVRVIALGSRSLEEQLNDGQLEENFAALFSAAEFRVPPLRERTSDIEELAQQFLSQFLRRYRKRNITLSKKALNALQVYHWPGNVNELKSVLERAVLSVNAESIEPTHLGLSIVEGAVTNIPLDLSLDGYFRYFVLTHQEELSETELALKLGISRKALWERRQKMDLPRNQDPAA